MQPAQKYSSSDSIQTSEKNNTRASTEGDGEEIPEDDGELIIVKKGRKRIISKIKTELHSAKIFLIRPKCMGSPSRGGSQSATEEIVLVSLHLRTLAYEMSVFSNSTFSIGAKIGDLQVLT